MYLDIFRIIFQFYYWFLNLFHNYEYKKIISGRLEELYDLTKQNGDFKESRQGLATLAKLWGLNEPDELKVTDTEIKFTFGNGEES